MNKKSVYNFFYILASIFLIAWIFVSLQGFHNWGGWLLMLFFLSIAIAFRGHKFLKGFSYTLMIFASVSLAMYYPAYFKTIGNFNLSAVIVPMLQLIMFGMGTELSLKDFSRIVQMPKGVIVGVTCHYIIMPMVGFGVAHLFNFPAEIAAGINSSILSSSSCNEPASSSAASRSLGSFRRSSFPRSRISSKAFSISSSRSR